MHSDLEERYSIEDAGLQQVALPFVQRTEARRTAVNFTRFAQDKEFIATEKAIETEWFTGRYDVLLGYRGERWLCDYKKSRRHRLYFEHKLQLVAYGMAEPADKFAIVATPDFALLELSIDDKQRSALEKMIVLLSQMYALRAEVEA
jgi:hypothetical protein